MHLTHDGIAVCPEGIEPPSKSGKKINSKVLSMCEQCAWQHVTQTRTPFLSNSPPDASLTWVLLINASHALLDNTDHRWLASCWLCNPKPHVGMELTGMEIRRHLKTWPCINITTIYVQSSLLLLVLLKLRKRESEIEAEHVGEVVWVEGNPVWADRVRIRVGWIDAVARTCQRWQMDVAKMKQVRH